MQELQLHSQFLSELKINILSLLSFLSSPIECVAFERLELLKTEITLAKMDHFFLCHFGV